MSPRYVLKCMYIIHQYTMDEMTDTTVHLCLFTQFIISLVKALRLPGNLPVHHVLKKAIDPPKSMAIQNATQLLLELGAFEEIILHGGLCSEKMTPLGWKLSQIPVHPCLGKMLLLGSLFERYAGGKDASKQIQSSSTFTYSTGDNTIPSILSPLISICSTLSFKSPFVLPFGKEKEADTARKLYGKGLFSDHLLFAKVLDEYNKQMKTASRGEFSKWLGANFLSGKTLEMSDKIQQDLRRYLKDLENGGEDSKVGNTSFGDRQQSSSDDRQQYHFQLKSTPLLSAILACSLNISFLPANRKRICSLHGGSTCSAHPSSLLSSIDSMVNERAVWNKYKHLMRGKNTDKAVEKFLLDQPNKIFVMGWFERLKTSDVYLRDCTLFGDPLPLLLLLPNVKQRGLNCAKETRSSPYARDPTIFEVVGGKSSHGGDSSDPELLRKKQVKNDNLQQEPMLLLRVKDEKTAKLLNALRAKLASFFCAVFSRRATSNGSICLQTEENMRAVFSGLKRLIDKSHSHYAQDGRSKNIDADNDLLNEVMNLSNFAECVILDPNKSDEDDMNDDCLGNDDYDDVQNEEYYFGSENSSRSPNYNGSNQWNRGRGRGYHARGRGRGSQQMRRNNR